MTSKGNPKSIAREMNSLIRFIFNIYGLFVSGNNRPCNAEERMISHIL